MIISVFVLFKPIQEKLLLETTMFFQVNYALRKLAYELLARLIKPKRQVGKQQIEHSKVLPGFGKQSLLSLSS